MSKINIIRLDEKNYAEILTDAVNEDENICLISINSDKMLKQIPDIVESINQHNEFKLENINEEEINLGNKLIHALKDCYCINTVFLLGEIKDTLAVKAAYNKVLNLEELSVVEKVSEINMDLYHSILNEYEAM